MKQIAQAARAGRPGSLAIVLPLAFGMVGALGSSADAFTIAGRVTNANGPRAGEGVEGVTVVAISPAQDPNGEVPKDVTDANGNYSIIGSDTIPLVLGRYFVFAYNESSPKRIFRQGNPNRNPEDNPGRNPVPIIFKTATPVDATVTINFQAFGLDTTRPTVTLTTPDAAAASTPIPPPTFLRGTAADAGNDPVTNPDGSVHKYLAAGVGQVAIGIGRNIQNILFQDLPTQLFNFETRIWEDVDPLAIATSGGFTPANVSLARFLLPANTLGSNWQASLTWDDDNDPSTPRVPLTDASNAPLFTPGERYAIGYGVVDKAGNTRGRLTIFTIEGTTP